MLIRNKIIPFNGYKSINIFGIIFYKGNLPKETDLNHEYIHTAQMKEMLYIFFYVWYGIEWFIRLFLKGNAYKNVSLEREAYINESNLDYLSKRKHFSWFKYLKNKQWNH